MPAPKRRTTSAARNPARTRERILTAALREFAAHGFAGARVDAIAKRAGSNKRMLYHYFSNKEGLFSAVLRHKIKERLNRGETHAPKSDLVSSLPFWFKLNCLDTDWVRLLAWESLQTPTQAVLDEKERVRIARWATARIGQKQKAGHLRKDVSAAHLCLAKVSLAMFPVALPQVARLITGRSPHDPKFQRAYTKFLETISTAFRP
jgi:AcrR family transcriptional regulator